MNTSKKRILYFLAYPKLLAGANRSFVELVTNLPEHLDPVIVLTGEGDVADACREAGVETHVFEPQGALLSSYGKAVLQAPLWEKLWMGGREYARYAVRLWRLLRRLDVDLVHTNEPRGALLIGPVAKLAGKSLVAHQRGEVSFGGWVKRFYLSLPHRFICVSLGTKESLPARAEARATVVYNGTQDISGQGTPIPWLQAVREAGKVVVCCFALVVPFKGYHHLMRAVHRLNERGCGGDAIFVCLGDLKSDYPAYRRWLMALKDELALPNVTFAGWQDDPFGFYQSADATVLPSVSREVLTLDGEEFVVRGNEGFPRTHLEAMSFGLPIVGTDIAGVTEQGEDGYNGFVVPPGDPEALADALEKLIADARLRKRMGTAGKKRVAERFSTEAYVRHITEVYDKVLGI